MSEENDRLKILLEQSQRNFIPPVTIQIDTAQIQNIIHGLCKEMISLKKEVTQLKGQLESKTDHADFSVFSNQINNNINELMIQHNDDVKQINSNVEDLKNALIAGLDKCLADAGSVAREMVSEIKPTSPREIARSVTPTQNYQPPIPPAEIVKLTQQIQDLSQRVTQIEENHNNQNISNLQQQINDQVQQLTNKDIVVDQQFSSEPSSNPPSPHKQREQVDQDSSSLPPSTVTSQKNSPSRSSIHTPNPEISNQLDDINNAIAQLKERLSMLEGSEQLRNMENRDSFENVSKLLQEQNDQMKKLSEELSTLKSTSEATTRSVKTLEPIKSDISEEVIAQLKSKIQDLESNISNCVTITDLNNQMANQKGDFNQFKEMLDECKKQIEETAKQAQLALEQTSQDAALQQTDEFKDLYDLPSKRSSNIPNEEQNKAENNNSDQKAMDSKEEREATPPATKPPTSAINTDELLDSFLDASQVEFEKMRKGLMDEISQNIRNISTQLQSSIAKESTKFDLGLKKVTTQVTEQGNQFQSDFKTHNYEQMNAIKDLHVTDSALTERIRALEERIEALTKLATAPPPKIETLIDEKGKLDLTPILQQMQAQTAMCNDLSSRIVVLENKEEVSPQSFNSLAETISGHEQKLSSLEITATQTDLKISELKEMQTAFQKKLDNPEEDPRITEIREIVMSVEDESKRLRDAMVKFNKDLISCRAAINTLRAHSEETAGIIDDIRKVSEQAKEESTATDKRLKKVIVFIQNENSNFGNQLKDVAQSVERNANRIEEISGRCAEIEALATAKGDHKTKDNKDDDDDEFNYYSESSETEKSKPTTAKSSHSAKVDIMTSPHVILPAEDEQTKKEELLIPKIQQPQPQQPMMSASQVVQLPPQVVYEQPIVSVIRKQIENEQFRNTTKSSLPRLGKGPTLTTKQGGDVTRNELRKYDELFGKIDQLDQKYSAMKSAIDGLTKQAKQLHESKAEKDALQALFDQFRLAMGELNNRIGTLRKNIIQKADIAELQQLRAEVVKEIKIQGETAAGTEPVRCLLCGNPRHGISGAADGNQTIQPQQMQQTNNRPSAPVAPGMSTRVSGADGNACYVYGENGQMFLGRSGDGKPIILKNLMNDPGNQGMAPGDNSTMLEAT